MLTKLNLLKVRAETIVVLYLSNEIKFKDMLDALIVVGDEIDQIESEEAYNNSLKDSLDSPEAFLYKGKE